ncbi:LysR family transcriptional regulator [Methylopila henanensis]|uniref:LysR family transcriptional regulator n=1 Tax=Methylopila henanensis TaxID=873516 RepID=A0ABW4K961_9HYPH
MIPELRTLLAVARHGTFAAAGDRVGLTQAAVSGHMRRLEEALGFPLFERTGRSARLNEAGLRTVRRAEALIASFEALGEPERDDAWEGALRVGAIASVQGTLLARALVPFRLRFPRCHIHVGPDVSLRLMDRVDAGEIDFAILIRPSFDPPRDLEWLPLVHEDYALIVPADVDGDDWRAILPAHSFIRYDRASFGGRQVERLLRNASARPRDWLEIDELDAMLAMVALGLGVAIAPLSESLLPLPPGVRAVALGPDTIRREIGVLRRAGESSPAAAALVEALHASRRAP